MKVSARLHSRQRLQRIISFVPLLASGSFRLLFVCGHITPISASCLTDSSSVCVYFCLSFIITSLIITFRAQPQNQEYLLISKSLIIISAKGSFPNEVAFTSSVLRTGISLLESHHPFSPLQLLVAKRGKSEASLTEVNTTLPKSKTINVNAMKHQLTGHTRNRTLQGWSEQNSDYGKLQNKNSVSSTGKLQVRWVREMEEETYM